MPACDYSVNMGVLSSIFGIQAAAIFLAIQAQLLSVSDGVVIALIFTEIGGKPGDAVLLLQGPADVVDADGVLSGGHAEGGAEPVEAQVPGQTCGLLHTQGIAHGAALTAFGFLFQTLDGLGVLLPFVVTFQKMHVGHGVQDDFLVSQTQIVFGSGLDVGVIVQQCQVEVLMQNAQHLGGAGAAAAMQQQLGFPLQSGQNFCHSLVIILIHCHLALSMRVLSFYHKKSVLPM